MSHLPILVALAALVALGGCGAATPAPCECHEVEPAQSRAPASEEATEQTLNVRAGECETDWLPSGTAIDLSESDEADLIGRMRAWLGGDPSQAPLIEHRRGIFFAKSADDEGADPPYPSSSAATSMRACGLTSSWLRDHVQATFAMAASPDFDGVTCDENVCCISGMEYVPDRAIVFRRTRLHDAPAWVIESTYSVAEAALGDEYVAANRRYVAEQLARGATSTCPGEPPGVH